MLAAGWNPAGLWGAFGATGTVWLTCRASGCAYSATRMSSATHTTAIRSFSSLNSAAMPTAPVGERTARSAEKGASRTGDHRVFPSDRHPAEPPGPTAVRRPLDRSRRVLGQRSKWSPLLRRGTSRLTPNPHASCLRTDLLIHLAESISTLEDEDARQRVQRPAVRGARWTRLATSTGCRCRAPSASEQRATQGGQAPLGLHQALA